jgi:peptide/nickel transport system permease protein
LTVDRLAAVSSGAAGGRARTAARRRVTGLLRQPLVRALARRVALSVPLVLLVSALLFVLLSLVPGNAAQAILGPGASPQQVSALSHELGLDKPLYTQYWSWLSSAVHGDFGNSIATNQSVLAAIQQHFPTTVSLVIGALLVSMVIGVALGVASAASGGPLGRVVDTVSVLGFSIPSYWLAAELIVFFAVKLRWFPATGYVPFSQSPTEWLRSVVLPVIALSALPVGVFAKFTRDGMLDVLASEHVRMTRASGIRRMTIISVNALKPASLQVVTLAGLQVVTLLTGTVFVENVFGLPGLGSLIVNATTTRDVPMVQGVAVFFTLIVIAANLVVDFLYGVLSPKVRAV